MSQVTIPEDLELRAQALADAEGISVAAFVIRCVEDAVGWMEQTEWELEGSADLAPSGNRRPMTVKEYQQMAWDGLKKQIAQAQPRPAPVTENKPMSVAEVNRRFLIAMGAVPEESA